MIRDSENMRVMSHTCIYPTMTTPSLRTPHARTHHDHHRHYAPHTHAPHTEYRRARRYMGWRRQGEVLFVNPVRARRLFESLFDLSASLFASFVQNFEDFPEPPRSGGCCCCRPKPKPMPQMRQGVGQGQPGGMFAIRGAKGCDPTRHRTTLVPPLYHSLYHSPYWHRVSEQHAFAPPSDPPFAPRPPTHARIPSGPGPTVRVRLDVLLASNAKREKGGGKKRKRRIIVPAPCSHRP